MNIRNLSAKPIEISLVDNNGISLKVRIDSIFDVYFGLRFYLDQCSERNLATDNIQQKIRLTNICWRAIIDIMVMNILDHGEKKKLDEPCYIIYGFGEGDEPDEDDKMILYRISLYNDLIPLHFHHDREKIKNLKLQNNILISQ
jgi:hypothetical protein